MTRRKSLTTCSSQCTSFNGCNPESGSPRVHGFLMSWSGSIYGYSATFWLMMILGRESLWSCKFPISWKGSTKTLWLHKIEQLLRMELFGFSLFCVNPLKIKVKRILSNFSNLSTLHPWSGLWFSKLLTTCLRLRPMLITSCTTALHSSSNGHSLHFPMNLSIGNYWRINASRT